MSVIAAEFGSGQVLWSLLWFSLFVLWFWLVITIFVDIMHNPDLSGWGKGLWAVGIIIIPFLGIILYLIVNGGKSAERAADEARSYDEATQAYIRQTAGTADSPSEELTKLADLHSAGTLSDSEYEAAKAKAVQG